MEALRPCVQVRSWTCGDDGNVLGGRDVLDRLRARLVLRVGVDVRGEHAVVALRPLRVVDQRPGVQVEVHARLVVELRGRLQDVDRRPVGVGEAHREPGAGEQAGAIGHERVGPVVVVRVQADAHARLGARLDRPAAPGHAVRSGRDRLRQAHAVDEVAPLRQPLGAPAVLGEDGRRGAGAHVLMHGDLEARRLVGGEVVELEPLRLQRRPRRPGIDVGGHPRAGPLRDRAAGGIAVEHLVEAGRRAGADAVVVAGHDDRGLQVAREVPEARERHPVRRGVDEDVREQPLLLVGLRDLDLAGVDPVREEEVAGAQRGGRRVVALLIDPVRVALAGVDDRARQVVREGGGLARRRPCATSRPGRPAACSRRRRGARGPSRPPSSSGRRRRGTASTSR